ncbi:MAG: hypothetical protein ACRYHC_15465 [Janthinobacterium lividum]
MGSLVVPPDHGGEASINILHCYAAEIEADLCEIRQRIRLKLTSNGRFIRWNTGEFLEAAFSEDAFTDLSVRKDPLPEQGNMLDDWSHAVISGMPATTLAADMLLDLVRPLIKDAYQAIVQMN